MFGFRRLSARFGNGLGLCRSLISEAALFAKPISNIPNYSSRWDVPSDRKTVKQYTIYGEQFIDS